jgi:hypothetical protein
LISVYFIVAVVHGVKLPQFKCKRQFNPRKIFRLIMGSACRWRANLRRYRTLGFQIKFETPRVIGAAAENFGEGAQLHCGIFRIRNRSISALVAPCRHEGRALWFQAATLTRLGGGKPLDSASRRSASS